MIETRVDMPAPAGIADGFLYRPAEQGVWPGVIMLPDFAGIRDDFKAMARRLCGHGYMVLLPNVYYRQGPYPQIDHVPVYQDPVDRALVTPWADAVRNGLMPGDVAAYVDWLAGHAQLAGGVGAVGYCLTGAMAIYAAIERPDRVAAAASFHGSQLAMDLPDSLPRRLHRAKGRLYFAHVRNDVTCPEAMIVELDEAITQTGVDAISEYYPCKHGFGIDGHVNYDAASNRRGWRRMLELFDTTLKP